jgi:hypothetical protein
MNKEKFHIPMPGDETIKKEINAIISAGIKRKESFFAFLMDFYREVGLRYLFTNQRDGILMTISTMVVSIFLLFLVADSSSANDEAVYAFLFFISPLMFAALTVNDLFGKKYSGTYELEMTTKYHLYQAASFRLFVFSMISILVNTAGIAFLAWMGVQLEFFRAFILSATALFIFSIFFLIVFIKGRTGLAVIKAGTGWVGFSVLTGFLLGNGYASFILTGPVYPYVFILSASIGVYIRYLNRLVRMKPAEGVM